MQTKMTEQKKRQNQGWVRLEDLCGFDASDVGRFKEEMSDYDLSTDYVWIDTDGTIWVSPTIDQAELWAGFAEHRFGIDAVDFVLAACEGW